MTDHRQAPGQTRDSELYSFFNQAHLLLVQQRQRAVLNSLRRQGWHSFQGKRILELGCGRGNALAEYVALGAQPTSLTGVEIVGARVTEAHGLLPGVPVVCADGQNLPYASGTFDLVFQYTVFSSVLDNDSRARIAREILRVLRPRSGLILWYDFWLNPYNQRTRGIRPAEIRSLFPDCSIAFQRVTLAPPIARRLAPYSALLCEIVEKAVVFNSHYLAAIRPVK